jgi:hypothetical protein
MATDSPAAENTEKAKEEDRSSRLMAATKSQIRNPKSETNSNYKEKENSKPCRKNGIFNSCGVKFPVVGWALTSAESR